MNDQQLTELRALREEQGTLKWRLRLLEERLARLEDQAEQAQGAPAPAPAAQVPPPLPAPAAVVPRAPLPPKEAPAASIFSLEEIEAAARQTAWKKAEAQTRDRAASPEKPFATPTQTSPKSAPPRESLEVRIGSTWLVRIGVVVFLTALAYGGNFLYHHIVPHLGPAAKVALLYVGAGALTGVGAWLEQSRQAREQARLRDYAQVLFAGGLAAVYYVTYVAHYLENLRVIQSSLLAGALLLAWTAFMVFVAHRRGSETIATIAILLGYYTAAINEGVAAFTLFSNLALTGGAVFLLRRHLWRVFPFASVLATFGSYGFWTYYHSLLGWRGVEAPPVHGVHGAGGLWIEAAFLLVYWALFTWVVFTATEPLLPAVRRAGFASLNNGAFFLLVTWLVLGEGPGWFWKWSLGFGAVLLALAEACRYRRGLTDPKTEDTYRLQGVFLVTTGFIAYFDGWQLSLVLAIEAATLLAAAGRRASRVLLGLSMATALLAFLWVLAGFQGLSATGPWVTPLGVGAVLVGAAYLAQRLLEKEHPAEGSSPFGIMLRPVPAYLALLASMVWLFLIADRVPTSDTRILAFLGVAVVTTASVYVLRIKALTVCGEGFLIAAFLQWAGAEAIQLQPGHGPSGLSTSVLLAGTLALGHWWQRLPGNTLWMRSALPRAFNALNAVFAVFVIFGWFLMRVWFVHPQVAEWVAEAAGLALLVFLYAVASRYRALAVAAQGLLLASVLFFLNVLDHTWSGDWREAGLTLVPLLVVLALLAAVRFLVPSEKTTRALRVGVVGYELLATLLFLLWTAHYLPDHSLLAVYTVAGAGLFALGVERAVRRWLLLSIVPTVAGVGAFFLWEGTVERGSLLNLLGVAALAGQQQFGRRRLGGQRAAWFPPATQNALMAAATLCAWVFVTARMSQGKEGAFTLAASWSIFAALVFTAGLLLRERTYRWLGLLVLAGTLGHIIIFDFMRMDSLGKTVSLFALSVVLIGVGFLYNKYQDKIRDLL